MSYSTFISGPPNRDRINNVNILIDEELTSPSHHRRKPRRSRIQVFKKCYLPSEDLNEVTMSEEFAKKIITLYSSRRPRKNREGHRGQSLMSHHLFHWSAPELKEIGT
jgi:hypothetical protein